MTDINLNDIDPADFGLPTNAFDGEKTPGFMYAADDLELDEDDPIYQATKAAWEREHGSVPPKPGEDERPPEMPTEDDDASDSDGEPTPPPTAEGEEEPGVARSDDADGVGPELGTPDSEDAANAQAGARPDDGGDEPAVRTLDFSVDGQDISLNPEQAEYLLRVNTWLDNIPEDTKIAWAGIESGTHVAISTEEYQRLIKGAQPARTPQAPDIDDLDDDTIAYIRSLEARIPQDGGPATQDAPPQPDTMELQAAFQRQAEQRARMQVDLDATNKSYTERYNLTDDQLARLEEVTANLQVIPSIMRSMTQYSPTGQIIREPGFGDVVAKAYEIAMQQDPTLRQIRDDMIYNERVAREADANRATNAKKAKAGTIASAPSAAVPAGASAPSIGPDNKMDLNATSEAIAKAIAQMRE